jgi:signal transduction histidine kinase
MAKRASSNYFIIVAVFIVGISITLILQFMLLKGKSVEERYEFEAQVSSLTLFITDSLNQIVNQFDLLAKVSQVNDEYSSDDSLAHLSELFFEEISMPSAFAIFSQARSTGVFSLSHMSGEYFLQGNSEAIESEFEDRLLKLIHNNLSKKSDWQTNSFFIQLRSLGKVSCLARKIQANAIQPINQRILVSCFKLDQMLDEILGRSSYNWLEAFLYLGEKHSGYTLVYDYASTKTQPINNPLSVRGDQFIFLPWAFSFADQNLSVLFSFQGKIHEASIFRFTPSLLGLFLSLSISGYLLSLKRRNHQISLIVEDKTKAYQLLNSNLAKEIENKENLFKQLHESSEELKVLTNSVNGVIWEADPNNMKYIFISEQVEDILGFSAQDYLNGILTLGCEPVAKGMPEIATLLQENFEGPDNFTLEYQSYRNDSTLVWIRNIVSKIFEADKLIKVRGVFFDITEEKQREEQSMAMEIQLKHAQKMEAIGQLAAGIAHEINTPAQFVGDNLSFISQSTNDFMQYYQQLEQLLTQNCSNDVCNQLDKAKQQYDIEFIAQETPQAIEQSIEGVARISKIVSAMKDFSHPGKDDKQKIDINKAIENTSIVARNEWKYLAELAFDFATDLPLVNCFPGEVNQVILNMIVNACHAIEDVTMGKSKGHILITTQQSEENVIIKIEDNGAGMDESVSQRVFDPFFTTKEVGKGTGQGLSLAYSVIVEQHAGKISVESTVGSGTTFVISLPI